MTREVAKETDGCEVKVGMQEDGRGRGEREREVSGIEKPLITEEAAEAESKEKMQSTPLGAVESKLPVLSDADRVTLTVNEVERERENKLLLNKRVAL